MGRSGNSRRSTAWFETFHGQFKKTKLCRLYMEGCCTYDAECAFAHSYSEVRPAADLTKTSMCAAWQRGVCSKPADECTFAHGKDDMRKTLAFFKRDPPKVSGQPEDVDEPMRLPRWCSDSFPGPPDDGGDGGCGGGVDAKEALGPHFKQSAAAWLGGEDEQWQAAAPPGCHGGKALQRPSSSGSSSGDDEWKNCQGIYAAAAPPGDTTRDALSPTPSPDQEAVELAYHLSYVPLLKVTPDMEIMLIAL